MYNRIERMPWITSRLAIDLKLLLIWLKHRLPNRFAVNRIFGSEKETIKDKEEKAKDKSPRKSPRKDQRRYGRRSGTKENYSSTSRLISWWF
jgi:hypothetical protein